MSIGIAEGSLLPVRRDKQISSAGSSISLGGNSGGGMGGGSMLWPAAAGIAVYDGSNAWGTSIADDSADWNAAYGWGDHALAGYLDAAVGIAYDSYRLGGALANTYAPLASPTFTGLTAMVSGVNAGPATSGSSYSGVTLRLSGNDSGVIDFGANSGTYLWIQSRDRANYATNYNLSINPNGGNVGIGTTAPVSMLDMWGGDFNIHTTDYNYATSTGTTIAIKLTAYTGNALGKIQIYNTGVHSYGNLTLQSEGGNVLIGQVTGSEKLCVTGNILVTTGGVKSESIESSTTFVSGFAGDGYKMIETGSTSSLECDSLTVRGTLKAYELQINKIHSINGGMVISVANAKCTTVSGTTIYFDEGIGLVIPFVVDDYIRAQQFNGTGIAAYTGKVTAVNAGNIVATTISGIPYNGMELVQMGNSNTATYSARQNLIYMTAADTNNPYIEGHTGITAGVMTDGTRKFRLGNLTGITDVTLSPSGYGLYAQNVFLSGKIVASSGTIGGFIITATELYAGSGATRVEMQAAGGFWAGADTFAAAQFSVSPAGVMKALGVAEFGTGNGSSVGNIALKFNRISNNGYNGLDDIVINYDGYAAGITQFRSLSIYDGKNNIIGAFDGPSKSLIMTGDLDCNGVVDFIGSPYVKLSQQHPMVTGATDITCSASETDMNAMSITVTPKGNRMFIMFSAPFYVSSANQTLNLYINVDGSDDAHTTTYIGSGFQAVSFQYIAPVTPGTPCIIKVRWLGSTSIQQRGSTDAKRVLTVMDLM